MRDHYAESSYPSHAYSAVEGMHVATLLIARLCQQAICCALFLCFLFLFFHLSHFLLFLIIVVPGSSRYVYVHTLSELSARHVKTLFGL